MKKALFATTALVLSAGVAAADVTISGYGRTGIIYYEDGVQTGGANDTQVISRLRMNIDASTTTDHGIDFGARFRIQWDQNSGARGDGGTTNAGKLYVTSQGLTVEVGNVDTAIDNVNLFYASELGSYDRSVGGNMIGSFYAYESSEYGIGNTGITTNGRTGVRALYELDNLTVQASYITPDQRVDLPVGVEEEIGFAVSYVWNDVLELAAGAALNAAGIDEHDVFFVGARYAVMENARIGLNYYDNGGDDGNFALNAAASGNMHGIVGPNDVEDLGSTVTLYGDYTLADGATNIEAYVAHNDGEWTQKETDNAFGIGVNYDLGGARLGASIQRDYQERVTADMGVRFNF